MKKYRAHSFMIKNHITVMKELNNYIDIKTIVRKSDVRGCREEVTTREYYIYISHGDLILQALY